MTIKHFLALFVVILFLINMKAAQELMKARSDFSTERVQTYSKQINK